MRKKILDYQLAKLSRGKSECKYVYYYALNPSTGLLERKRIKVNHYGKDWHIHARKMVEKINLDLLSGWNPFISQDKENQYTSLNNGIELYLSYVKENKRYVSFKTYRNMSGYLLKYFSTVSKINFLIELTSPLAIKFFDYLQTDKQLSERTYNSYVLNYRTIWNYLMLRNYVKANPFITVKMKREPKRIKLPIESISIQKIHEYCLKEDPYLWCVIGLCFYCSIRRSEITKLRIKHILFSTQEIFIPATCSKNNNDRLVTVPDEFFHFLQDKVYKNAKPDHFIISCNKKPGTSQKHPNSINRWFNEMKDKLHLPDETKFYRLKHTTLTKLAAVDLIAAQHHAGHSDITELEPYMTKNASEVKLIRAISIK